MMNLLQKLTDLMKRNGDTVASLSRKSGIPYTTIDGLFKKGFSGARIGTIKEICRVYGVSLDYLIRDEIDDPTYGLDSQIIRNDEQRLLRAWRAADETYQHVALELLEAHPKEQVAPKQA